MATPPSRRCWRSRALSASGPPGCSPSGAAPSSSNEVGAPAWEERDGARHRELDQTFGTGHVITTVVEATAPASPAPALSPGALLHAFVLSGRVVAGPLDDQHRLEKGDFIRFPGDVPHVLGAATGTATVHVVTTLPQAQQFTTS